jgi:hypothetical protein
MLDPIIPLRCQIPSAPKVYPPTIPPIVTCRSSLGTPSSRSVRIILAANSRITGSLDARASYFNFLAHRGHGLGNDGNILNEPSS